MTTKKNGPGEGAVPDVRRDNNDDRIELGFVAALVNGGDTGWLDRVPDTDLGDPHLRPPLAAIRRLHADGHPVNAETVNAELARGGALTDPVRARMRDIATAGTPEAATYYGDQVVMQSRTRQAISHAEALVASSCPDEMDRHFQRLSEVMQAQAGGLLADVITAADLGRMDFPDLVEHVPHLVTEGFGLLAAPPKVGKTWLACGLALACTQGGWALGGIGVQQRAVLMLALEDGRRRIQSRLRKQNNGGALPDNLDIKTVVRPGAVEATIRAWLHKHRRDTAPPLVILDTLGRARQQRRSSDDPYLADYQLGTRLKALTDAVPGSALLAVHHTRKLESVDFVNEVGGTYGISGSADFILVLRRQRKNRQATLAVTGRDIAETELALTVDDGVWLLDGQDVMDAAATVETRSEEAQRTRLGSRSLDIMQFVASRPETTPVEMATHLRIDNGVAGTQMARLAKDGYITKIGRGRYGPIQNNVESVESVETAGESTKSFSTLPLPGVETSGSVENENHSPPADKTLSTLSTRVSLGGAP